MGRKLPTKLWCIIGVPPTPFEKPIFGAPGQTRAFIEGWGAKFPHRIGRVTIKWEPEKKRKARK